ncbi:extracellular matrix protein 1 [Patagioenas fasciata]|uniref:extracellular matrix protein 1 n=1 Tax=Patagioenas fasciata TaxID=372321 RepID=UPI0032E86B15
MAARGLLLILLGAAVVAPEHPLQVAQETLELELELEQQHVEQLLQQEQDPPLPPDILVAAGVTRPPLSLPGWGSALDGFPPAWPEAPAVTQHCQRLPAAPPAPPLPPSSFAHLRRQAAALAALHPRISACCQLHQPLPCARRAWTDVLDDFCADEFGVKTRQFHCCRQDGAARRRCFARGPDAVAAAAADAPPTAVVTDWAVPAPPFPPGEPTAANWGNICGFSGLRRSLPGPSGPRGRMSLRLEREFGRCCRNQSLDCAHRAWQKGLERFCREEAAVKTGQHRCCQRLGGARSRCFAAAAPHPNYDRELYNVSLARPGPALLRSLCAPTRLLTKRRPVPELLGAVTSACCPVSPQQQSACAQDQLSQAIAALCASPWRDPRGCCSRGGPARRRCFEASYLAQVTLGAAVPPPPPGHDP